MISTIEHQRLVIIYNTYKKKNHNQIFLFVFKRFFSLQVNKIKLKCDFCFNPTLTPSEQSLSYKYVLVKSQGILFLIKSQEFLS